MIQTKGLTGAQTMLRVLGEMGVERIFASPGSEWSPLWEALAEPGVERMPVYMSTRHEEVALGMASGYAKSSGKLPAVVIHTTVAALHGAMAERGGAPGARADLTGIDELGEMLAGARRPVISADDAGRTAKSVECLVEMAELLGWPVVERRSAGSLNFPGTRALDGGYGPKEY